MRRCEALRNFKAERPGPSDLGPHEAGAKPAPAPIPGFILRGGIALRKWTELGTPRGPEYKLPCFHMDFALGSCKKGGMFESHPNQ